MNAKECLTNVENLIKELENGDVDFSRIGWLWGKKAFNLYKVYSECGVFDWFVDYLSMNHLKQMKTFLRQAMKLGFNGYVCFKVGASGCAHGMWAYKDESTTGYSPDGDVLYHSFRSDVNYYDAKICDTWAHKIIDKDFNKIKLADIKEFIKKNI